MKLLAVSTSAKKPSAALLLDDGSIIMREDATGRPHSVSLMTLVDALFEETGVCASDMDAFAADVGPGSFTGVRIGVSVINAMAMAVGKPVIGVPSLAALALSASGNTDTVVSMLDCRNGNAYAAVYENGECIVPPCACLISDMQPYVDSGAETVGDVFDKSCQCSALLVIKEAQRMISEHGENCLKKTAVPMYLRPSQAERMKKGS